MRTVHLVTHPEATHHLDGLVGGWFDSDLTPAGLRAAGSIATALRGAIPPDVDVELHASDLRRTARTAELVGVALRVAPRLDPGLREISYGDAEGRPQAWLDERYVLPPATGDRMRHDHGVARSETRLGLASRVYAAVDRILAGDCRHQVIVTHGFAATFVIAAWIGLPLEAAGLVSFRVSPGGISVLGEDDVFHNRQVVRLDDVRHLRRAVTGPAGHLS